MTDPDETIQKIVDAARAAVSELPFEKRAELVLRVAEGVRDALYEEETIGAPNGREWEVEGLSRVAAAAQTYTDAASAARR